MPARYGSDLIVDLMKVLGIEYVALNPGSSFRGIHDSLVNYESGTSPILRSFSAATKKSPSPSPMATPKRRARSCRPSCTMW